MLDDERSDMSRPMQRLRSILLQKIAATERDANMSCNSVAKFDS